MASESIALEAFGLDRVFIHKLNSLSYFVQYNQAAQKKSIT